MGERTERVELTCVCLLRDADRILLQKRVKKDWIGWATPGGHIEPGESIVGAVVREMCEETGLTVKNPRLCGVKHWPIEGGRYIVFLFVADEFEGELRSSDEGEMRWFARSELGSVKLAGNLEMQLAMMEDEALTEIQFVEDGDRLRPVVR